MLLVNQELADMWLGNSTGNCDHGQTATESGLIILSFISREKPDFLRVMIVNITSSGEIGVLKCYI